MREVVLVLVRLGAPYYLSEGSLLYLYRDCGLGQSDLAWSPGDARRPGLQQDPGVWSAGGGGL